MNAKRFEGIAIVAMIVLFIAIWISSLVGTFAEAHEVSTAKTQAETAYWYEVADRNVASAEYLMELQYNSQENNW